MPRAPNLPRQTEACSWWVSGPRGDLAPPSPGASPRGPSDRHRRPQRAQARGHRRRARGERRRSGQRRGRRLVGGRRTPVRRGGSEPRAPGGGGPERREQSSGAVSEDQPRSVRGSLARTCSGWLSARPGGVAGAPGEWRRHADLHRRQRQPARKSQFRSVRFGQGRPSGDGPEHRPRVRAQGRPRRTRGHRRRNRRRAAALRPGLLEERGPDGMLDIAAIADAYWMLHLQHRSAWTLELDLRPWVESF